MFAALVARNNRIAVGDRRHGEHERTVLVARNNRIAVVSGSLNLAHFVAPKTWLGNGVSPHRLHILACKHEDGYGR